MDHPDMALRIDVMPPTWPRIQLFGSGFGQGIDREGRDVAGVRVRAASARR